MSKYEVGKLLEAFKLNKRTGIPLAEPAVTIPYGGILEHVVFGEDVVKFHYMGEPFQIKASIAAGAFHEIPGTRTGDPKPASATAGARTEPVPERPRLVFESMDVRAPGHSLALYRARIPGGWLVASHSGGVAFVPDGEHTWDGTSVRDPA